jgi:hypothetical protein
MELKSTNDLQCREEVYKYMKLLYNCLKLLNSEIFYMQTVESNLI